MAAIAAGIVVSNSLPAEPEVPKSPAVVSCQTAVAIAAAVGGSPPTAVPFHSVTFIPTRPPPYPLSSSPVESVEYRQAALRAGGNRRHAARVARRGICRSDDGNGHGNAAGLIDRYGERRVVGLGLRGSILPDTAGAETGQRASPCRLAAALRRHGNASASRSHSPGADVDQGTDGNCGRRCCVFRIHVRLLDRYQRCASGSGSRRD